MSELTGPGRNSDMSTIRSPMPRGASLVTSSRWPGDSIWKQPVVRPERIISNVGSSPRLIASMSTRSPRVRSISSSV